MELGEKIRQARLEAGLSQRALCDGEITRNMLSLIENGSAKPSMKTLSALAQRLGKPVSWFLEETVVVSANIGILENARQRFDNRDWEGAAAALEGFSGPDPVYGRERDLIWVLSHLALAEKALDQGRIPYAVQLLEKADLESAYCGPELRRRRLLLLGRMGQKVAHGLPSIDQELLLRSREALESEDTLRAGALLDAAQDRQTSQWNLLRGQVWLAQGEYREAARCFHLAEGDFPRETIPGLEQCYKELGDFQRAYEYACKGR